MRTQFTSLQTQFTSPQTQFARLQTEFAGLRIEFAEKIIEFADLQMKVRKSCKPYFVCKLNENLFDSGNIRQFCNVAADVGLIRAFGFKTAGRRKREIVLREINEADVLKILD